MRLTCDKKELVKSLTIVMRVVNNSATLESLRGVQIKTINKITTLKATNLEVGIEITIPVVDTEDGEFLVSPKILLDAIKYSTSKNVDIIKAKGNTITVKLDTGNTIIKTLGESDFPNIIKEQEGDKIQLNIKNIVNGIRSVIYSVSHSVIKPELSSVYIWQEGQQLVFVATDSFRLAEKRVSQKITSTDDLSILIPQKNTQDLLGVLEQIDEDVNIDVYVDKDQFSVYVDNMYITLRTIDGVFPDYQKIIPSDPIAEVTVLKYDLSQTLKKAGVFSDKFDKITIKADAATDGIVISTLNGDYGETTDSITGVLEGDSVEIALNYRYVSDSLQSINADSVVLSFFGQGKPLIMRGVGDKSFTYLVMPMNN